MGNTPTNDNNDDNGFSEEPDDIFEPRTSINEGEVENLSARTRALLSLSDGKSRSFDEFSFGDDTLGDIYGDLGVSPVETNYMYRAASNSFSNDNNAVIPYSCELPWK